LLAIREWGSRRASWGLLPLLKLFIEHRIEVRAPPPTQFGVAQGPKEREHILLRLQKKKRSNTSTNIIKLIRRKQVLPRKRAKA